MNQRTLILVGVAVALVVGVVVYMLSRKTDPVTGKVDWAGAGTPFMRKPTSTGQADLGTVLAARAKDLGSDSAYG